MHFCKSHAGNFADKKTITLSHDFERDLYWFIQFLHRYTRISYFDHKCIDGTIELDACLTGFGGCWENFVYHVPIEKKYKNLAITQLEMLNILLALHVFSQQWARKCTHETWQWYRC